MGDEKQEWGLGHSKLIFSFWSYSPFVHDVGGQVIKTIGLRQRFMKSQPLNIIPFVAAVTFVMCQKVHLLLDDITVVAAEGDERCLGGPRMHRTLFRFSELHNSHFLHRSNCGVLIN